jgi:hypothetical protein
MAMQNSYSMITEIFTKILKLNLVNFKHTRRPGISQQLLLTWIFQTNNQTQHMLELEQSAEESWEENIGYITWRKIRITV